MALVCGVLTSWQKEIANTTCLNSTRTHSQKSEEGGRETGWLVGWFACFFFVVFFCLVL